MQSWRLEKHKCGDGKGKRNDAKVTLRNLKLLKVVVNTSHVKLLAKVDGYGLFHRVSRSGEPSSEVSWDSIANTETLWNQSRDIPKNSVNPQAFGSWSHKSMDCRDWTETWWCQKFQFAEGRAGSQKDLLLYSTPVSSLLVLSFTPRKCWVFSWFQVSLRNLLHYGIPGGSDSKESVCPMFLVLRVKACRVQ